LRRIIPGPKGTGSPPAFDNKGDGGDTRHPGHWQKDINRDRRFTLMPRPSVVIIGVLLAILIACILSAGCSEGLPLSSECSYRVSYGGNFLLTKDQPEFKLTTPEANKNCHAQMTLTYWYKDQALAESGTKPPVMYNFRTWTGGFPDPVSKQVDAYNDQGVKVKAWKASVDEAAKNAQGDYTYYSVYVFYPRGTTNYPKDGVEADIEISYVPFKQGQSK